MTKTKSIIARHLCYNLIVQATTIAFLGLPALQPIRAELAVAIGIPTDATWIPFAFVVFLTSIFSFNVLRHALAEPLRDIADQCQSGHIYASHREQQSREEVMIREYLTQRQVLTHDIATKLERAESELISVRKERDRAVAKRDEAEDLLAEYTRIRQELSVDNASLRAERERLAESLATERKAKIGLEVEQRGDEIQKQMENAVSSAAVRSIWLPRILSELRHPVTIAHGLAQRMVNDWEHSTLSHLKQSAQEILRQCSQQLDRLKELPLRLETYRNGATSAAKDSQDSTPESPLASIQSLADKDEFKGIELTVGIPTADRFPQIAPAAQHFIRALCYMTRSQIEVGGIHLELGADEDGEPACKARLTSAEPNDYAALQDSIAQLAQTRALPVTVDRQLDGSLLVIFPVAASPARDGAVSSAQ